MLRISPRVRRILFDRLKSFHIGDESCAQRELRWMLDAVELSKSASSPRYSLLRLRKMVRNRCTSMPLAYAIGTQPFGNIELEIKPPILIPRPETEYWVSRLSEKILESRNKFPCDNRKMRILDLCTGSGCISAYFSDMLPRNSAELVAVDILPDAVHLARKNTELCSYSQNPTTVLEADIFAQDFHTIRAIRALSPFDLIISNPPYIPYKDWEALEPSVKDWESPLALISNRQRKFDDDGLHFYRRIASLVPSLLNRNHGILAVECSFDQTSRVTDIFQQSLPKSFLENASSVVWNDQFDLPRTVILQFGNAVLL